MDNAHTSSPGSMDKLDNMAQVVTTRAADAMIKWLGKDVWVWVEIKRDNKCFKNCQQPFYRPYLTKVIHGNEGDVKEFDEILSHIETLRGVSRSSLLRVITTVLINLKGCKQQGII